ncbi:MAG: hypothetical protein ACJAV5_001147 [Vicingaceae bacterium]|jgi:hypothetical protein
MKLIVHLIALFLLFNFSGFSQNKTFTFKGQVYSYGQTIKGVAIEVFEAGELVYKTTTNGGGKFTLELEAEQDYMVEVSMEKLQAKTIWINTKRTQGLDFKIPIFVFDVELNKEKITPYGELTEIPVTLIKYQPDKKVFYMDKTYEDAVENKKDKIKGNMLKMR